MTDDQTSPSASSSFQVLGPGLELPIMTRLGITILHFNSSALSGRGVGTESSEVSG